MSIVPTILLTLLGIYALATGIFLIAENRRPQATLAWLLAFFVTPGFGVLVYILFGRHWKAFSKQSRLLMQDLTPNARPILSPLLSRQDAEIKRLEVQSTSHRKLMTLVRRNSHLVSVTMTQRQPLLINDAGRRLPTR
jgi:cardiolipin synthase